MNNKSPMDSGHYNLGKETIVSRKYRDKFDEEMEKLNWHDRAIIYATMIGEEYLQEIIDDYEDKYFKDGLKLIKNIKRLPILKDQKPIPELRNKTRILDEINK